MGEKSLQPFAFSFVFRFAIIASAVIASMPTFAQDKNRDLDFMVGWDGSPIPAEDLQAPRSASTLSYPILGARYVEREHAPGDTSFELEYISTAIAGGWHVPRPLGERTHLSLYAKGEMNASAVLLGHAIDGRVDPNRGFNASSIMGGGTFSTLLWWRGHNHLTLDWSTVARRWVFDPRPETSPDLVLPPNMSVLELGPRLRGFWGTRKTDFKKLHGVDGQAGVEAHLRRTNRNWGSLGSEPDARNIYVTALPILGRARISGGYVFDPMAELSPYLGARTEAGSGFGLDDINRFQIGGNNLWTIPLAGAGWTEFRADRFAAFRGLVGVAGWERVALEVGVDGVWLNDPLRIGDDGAGAFFSGGLIQAEADFGAGFTGKLGLSTGFNLPRAPGDNNLRLSFLVAYNAF
jgi:hypothetical protein